MVLFTPLDAPKGPTDRPRASAAPPWVGKSRHRSSERARQPYEDAACANRTPLWRPFRASMMIPYSQGGATRLAPRGLPWADMLRPLRGNRNGPNRNGCQTQIVLSSGWGCGTIAVDPEKGKTLCTYVTAASSNVRYKPAGRRPNRVRGRYGRRGRRSPNSTRSWRSVPTKPSSAESTRD